MKNIFLVLGFGLLFLNTVLCSMLSSIDVFHIIWTDISIILSAVFLGINSISKSKDGFKISFAVFICITGLIRYVFALNANNTLTDNYFLILCIILIFLESALLFLGDYLSKKN